MKLLFDKEVLLSKLSQASRFTSSRFSTLASLQGVLLEQKDTNLHIYATNLNSFFHTKIKTKESGVFKVVIDPRKILEFLSFLTPQKIEVEVNDKEVVIIQDKNTASFPIMIAADFPQPQKVKEEKQKIKPELLTKSLPLVLFAASQDESRPVLNGVNFVTQDEDLLIVATDGFRLSLLKTKRDDTIPPMIIPSDFLQEVARFAKDEKEIFFGYSDAEKVVQFIIGENEFYSRLIDGEFPPFDKVIPQEHKTTITCEREELVRSVKLVSVFARDSSNIIVLQCNSKGVYLRPKTEVEGKNEVFLDGKCEGDDQVVAFNFKYLLEFLNTIDEKEITINILRPDAPVVFKAKNLKDFIHIVMPIRIQQ